MCGLSSGCVQLKGWVRTAAAQGGGGVRQGGTLGGLGAYRIWNDSSQTPLVTGEQSPCKQCPAIRAQCARPVGQTTQRSVSVSVKVWCQEE